MTVPSLKIRHLILSMLVLVMSCGWLIEQRREISMVERETIKLERQIAAASSAAFTNVPTAGNSATDTIGSKYKALDWSRILPQLDDWKRGMGDYNERMRFEKHLDSLSRDELGATLDEISRLDLPEVRRDAIAMALLPTLVGKDPEMALNRFIDKAGDRQFGSSVILQLEGAIKVWAEKDPGMACAWLDKRNASGKFEDKSISGINQTRIDLEQSLFKVLLPNAPQSAGARLMTMNTDEAFLLMGNLVSSATAKEHPTEFAALARQSLSCTQSIQVLSRAASLPSMDYAEVSTYLDKISASPAEREACVAAAAEKIIGRLGSHRGVTIEEVDAMRAWAGIQHSDIDGLTGKSLGNSISSEGMSFAEASELAHHYHLTTGNDDVLIGFLSSNAHCDIDGARLLAMKISNPSKRAEMLEKLK